jgi:phosphate acetyltransferase
LVVFDCRVRADGHDLVTGTVTVRAPTQRLHYAEVATPQVLLRRTDKYAKLLKARKALPPVTCVVAHPCDHDSLLGPVEAAKLGLIEPVLVGPEAKIRTLAGQLVDIMDVGFVCAYLATPYARRITGGTVYVDAGTNIRA